MVNEFNCFKTCNHNRLTLWNRFSARRVRSLHLVSLWHRRIAIFSALSTIWCQFYVLEFVYLYFRNYTETDGDENKLTKRENTSKTWFKSIITPSASIKRSRLGYSTIHRQTFRALLMENLISEFSISMQHSSWGGRVLCGHRMKICFAFNFGNKNIQKSNFCCYFKTSNVRRWSRTK